MQVDAQRPTLPGSHVRASTYGAIHSVNWALDCRQSRRMVSDIGIGYRPYHFLDI